jgi:hypothetical protein
LIFELRIKMLGDLLNLFVASGAVNEAANFWGDLMTIIAEA